MRLTLSSSGGRHAIIMRNDIEKSLRLSSAVSQMSAAITVRSFYSIIPGNNRLTSSCANSRLFLSVLADDGARYVIFFTGRSWCGAVASNLGNTFVIAWIRHGCLVIVGSIYLNKFCIRNNVESSVVLKYCAVYWTAVDENAGCIFGRSRAKFPGQ